MKLLIFPLIKVLYTFLVLVHYFFLVFKGKRVDSAPCDTMNKFAKQILTGKSLLKKLYATTVPNIIKENPIVTVKDGKLMGSVKKLYDESLYYSFKGIPYAQPPIGKLRFKAPLPPKPWQGIYEAIEHGPICPQVEVSKMKSDKEDENCLFINVYSRSLQSDARLPVMVYIYGGAYMSGSGNSESYGPEYLLQHDVVLVTFNYRVEAFGFLCLDTAEVPGNAAMKDQVAALRWVQNNIMYFGGDPNNVTIFGESAGGASVTYHMLSPMSYGLFHKVIAQSAVCIVYWAEGKGGKDRAHRLGKLYGKDTNDAKELLNFLQTLPSEAFTAKVSIKTCTEDEKYRGFPILFSPVVEKKFTGVESFIHEEPLDLILADKINKVPIMLGYNSIDGLFFVSRQLKMIEYMNENPQYTVPRNIAEKMSLAKMKELGKRINEFYVGAKGYTENDIINIAHREMDTNITYSTHRFAHFYSKLNKSIYMYVFDCDTDLNFAKKSTNFSGIRGASHIDDLYYLFKHIAVADVYEQQHDIRDLVYRITKLWANFAKTGNPTPDNSLGIKWNHYTTAGKEYLHIDENMSMMKQFADRERIEFWDKIYAELGLPNISESS